MGKRIALFAVGIMAVVLLVGCGKQIENMVSGKNGTESDNPVGRQVTLKFFSNLPDRQNGQGLVEQKVIDEYMKANPNVTIEVEALDDEAYKVKFKAYAMDGMPDIVNIWGQPSFLDEVLEAGILAELNEEDYADYAFVSGSLEGFKKNGKLYGLPRNTDVMVFYYNRKMFSEHGWSIPKTYEELLALAKNMQQDGVIPCAMDGSDGWPIACYWTDVMNKVAGPTSMRRHIAYAVENNDFSDDMYSESLELLVDAVNAGLFQQGFESQDYSAAKNLFINGQAAMFYMGSWEIAMAVDENIPQEIRDNIRVFTMPVVDGGVAGSQDIAAWHGGGYAVSEESAEKEEAIKFLNYMYKPDKLSGYSWIDGAALSAQDQTLYLTGRETDLQLQVMSILGDATSVSGTPLNDCGSSVFKTAIEKEIQNVSNGTVSIEEFLRIIQEAY